MNAPPLAPSRLRNRLAAVILAARHDASARDLLGALADGGTVLDEWLRVGGADAPASRRPVLAAHRTAVMARARRARESVAAGPPVRRRESLAQALETAAILFDAGLFFEAHEVLEPWWRRSSGDEGEALRGLIQIAVGYQHRAVGNAPGARSLIASGAARARGRRVLGIPLDKFVEAAATDGGRIGAHADAAKAGVRFPRGAGPTSIAPTPGRHCPRTGQPAARRTHRRPAARP